MEEHVYTDAFYTALEALLKKYLPPNTYGQDLRWEAVQVVEDGIFTPEGKVTKELYLNRIEEC